MEGSKHTVYQRHFPSQEEGTIGCFKFVIDLIHGAHESCHALFVVPEGIKHACIWHLMQMNADLEKMLHVPPMLTEYMRYKLYAVD